MGSFEQAESQNQLGILAYQAGRLDAAAEAFARAAAADPAQAQYAYHLGLALQDQGRLDEAVAAYRAALRARPGYPQALNNLGNALLAQRKAGEAAASFEQALALSPDQPEAHYNLALARHAAGDTARAAEGYRRALALQPAYADAHVALGDIALDMGRAGEALAAYERAIAVAPRLAAAHLKRGAVLHDLGRATEAEAAYAQAIALRGDYAEAHNNLGVALQARGALDAAGAAFDRALAIRPDFVAALANLGNLRARQGRTIDAAKVFRRAIALSPQAAELHLNLGNALAEAGDLAGAEAAFRQALSIRPDYQEARFNLGNTLKEEARLEAAAEAYEQAIALRPDDADARFNLSLTRLLVGDFARGLPLYEARKDRPGYGGRRYARPLWLGWGLGREDVAGKRVLVHWEQGFGDTFQFCRYLAPLRALGATVLFAPQPSLKALMRSLGPQMGIDIEIVDEDLPAAAFDLHVPLMSLPLALGTQMATIPGGPPYLDVDPARVAFWRERIGPEGLRIGVCWKANVENPDVARSFPLAALAPLSRLPGVRLISVYKGAGEDEPRARPGGVVVEWLGEDYNAGPDGFVDTAAAMKALDLVISADTASAHLAGALGVPAWIALKAVPDWRWFMGREDSPWYPSLRLFRQASPGDWNGVFSSMERALGARMRGA